MKKTLLIISLLMMLVGCSLPGLGGSARNDDIVVAGGNTAERRIMAEVLVQMVNHYQPELSTHIIDNLGTTMLIVQTITRQDANFSSIMYTGTSLTGELGMEATTNTEEAFWKVVQGYHEEYDAVWFPTYGFANTYAFMVRRDFAQQHGITKVSELEALASEVSVGVDDSWLTRQGDGYEDFQRIYGYSFDDIFPMSIGLVYTAVESGDVDVVLGYSTDGRVDAYDLVLLEDDLALFPPYDASAIVSHQVLEAHPELEEIVLKLENTIDETLMQTMNRQHDEYRIEAAIIAKEFLEENNYFEDKEVITLSQRPQYQAIFEGGN